jgi:hypothetical protein
MKPMNKVVMATVAGLIAIIGMVALSIYNPVSVHATAKEKVVVYLSQSCLKQLRRSPVASATARNRMTPLPVPV